MNRFDRSIIKKENPSTVFYEDDEVMCLSLMIYGVPPLIYCRFMSYVYFSMVEVVTVILIYGLYE